ncbi:MAG: hypothetical protein PHU21_05700 [Elusimicrobia bacterium]|jgi:hypothetical protein|nr:hypothetical protein [Elusimicrobiota bacterium]
MRSWSLLLVLGLPAAAWSADAAADPGFVVKVGDTEMSATALAQGRGEADVKDFESFLLVNMARRGVCLDKLGAAFYERLRRVLSRAAEENPTRLRYFVLAAPRFSEKQVTDVFVVLRDAPDDFSRYVEAQVRFFTPQASAGPAEAETSEEPPALREEQVSEAAIREYNRYMAHCPVIWVSDGSSGAPPAQCGYRAFDLQAAFTRVMGDAFGGGTRPAPPAVSAGGAFQVVGPAEPTSR